MPYCEPCDKWRAPNALLVDGTCPKCGNEVQQGEVAEAAAEMAENASAEAATAVKIPWHFWLMVGATVLYLGWRVIQGVGSLF